MNSPIIEILAPRYQIAWYPWAVTYFFLIALSYSSLWLSLPAVFGRPGGRWAATGRFALLAAMTTAICAPVALLADLHQPLRFWHFYAHFTPTSWMSIGSLILPAFVGSVVALTWLIWREPLRRWRAQDGLGGTVARLATLGDWPTPRAAVLGVGVFASFVSLGIAFYTGAEIAVVKGRPLWNTIWLPPLLVATGLGGAAGLVLLLNRVAGPRNLGTDRAMLATIWVAGIVIGLVVFSWVIEGLFIQNSSVAAAIDSVRHEPTWRRTALWGTLVGLALTITTLLMWVRAQKGLVPGAWAVGLAGLHMAWMARWVILMQVQTVQKQTAGYTEYVVGWHSSGWGGVIGILGLWIALMLIIDMFVPWREAFGGKAETRNEAEPRAAVPQGGLGNG